MTDDINELAMHMKDNFNYLKTGMIAMKNFIKRYDKLMGYCNIDSTVEQFIDSHCVKGSKLQIRYSDLFAAYKQQYPSSITSKAFSNTLSNLGYLPKRIHNYRVRTGLQLKEPIEGIHN